MKEGKSFDLQNGRPWLRPGMVVVVQPGYLVTEPYLCIVTEKLLNWVDGPAWELCTLIPWKHSAVINEHWIGRISPASFFQFCWFHILWFFKGTKRTNIQLTSKQLIDLHFDLDN